MMKRTLTAKLMVLAAVLFSGQVVLGVAGDYKDTPSPVRLYNRYLSEGRPIIYFGESTLYTTDPTEADRAPINEMLQRLLPKHPVGAIAHDAYHLELYAPFCEYIARRPQHPEIVIVPINLGTVNAHWDQRPQYQFERIKYFLNHETALARAFYRPLAAFRVLDLTPISQREFDQAPVYDGDTVVGTIQEFTSPKYETFTADNARDQLIVRYMYRVPPTHNKLKAMLGIADLAATTDIQFLFYLTPIDYETGERYVGPRFTERIRENADTVVRLLRGKGIDALDLSLALGADKFHWGSQYPNEHLNQAGRLYVAERLAEAIRRKIAHE